MTKQYNNSETGYAYYHLAFQQKKQQSFEQAYQSFKNAISFIDERQQIIALIELAKIDEHRHQNYEQAIYYTHQAYQLVKNSTLWKSDLKSKKLREIEKRKFRNEKKRLFPGK